MKTTVTMMCWYLPLPNTGWQVQANQENGFVEIALKHIDSTKIIEIMNMNSLIGQCYQFIVVY
ncbi:MAG: hypothetical protein QF852_02285 [Candidatus Marinimicrobia bacterium]|nr:hypothetical protein [Candidatus Neomarinimicrobiota bacterium]HJN68804.1 hypothetical protein [Candidatus Neomarinimicrobiota bacterium]